MESDYYVATRRKRSDMVQVQYLVTVFLLCGLTCICVSNCMISQHFMCM